MEILLTGVAIYLLTLFVDFLKKTVNPKISLRLVAVLLTLLAGSVYYLMNQYDPNWVRMVETFIAGAFATSQGIWMIVDKILPKDPQ